MKKIISTNKAPQAIGAYSQAVEANGIVFISGQIPLDPSTGEIFGLEVQEQTRRVLENMKEILLAAGCDFSHVVKTTCYLKSMDDFVAMNEVYSENFSEDPPARATVQVARLPKNVLIEIDAIAVKQ